MERGWRGQRPRLQRRSARGAGVIHRPSTRGLGVAGHLFQARFGSVARDEERLTTAAPYGFEPRAGAACRAGGRLALIERRRASGGGDDDLVSVAPLL
jgi:hypothetical protein